MSVNKTTLKNGIRVVTRRMLHTRSISMGVWVNVGARDESIEENGLSHFIEHMIFKGTTRRSAFQIAKEFDAIGGQTNAFTSMENTCYHARVVDIHLETMMDILSDILLNSVFHIDEVEKERPIVFQEISMVEDSPEEYIHVLSENAFWGEDPLGRSILGTRENVLRFDDNAIHDFFRKFYQPERIIISAAGNLDHNAIVDYIGPAFESIPFGNPIPERLTPSSQSVVSMNYRKLEQVHLCLESRGIALTDPRRYAFSLLNTLLGGNMSSRLFQRIREEKSLAYSVYSFISSYVDTGMFGVYAAVAPEKSQETIELILRELEDLKKNSVNPAELEDAKSYTKGCLLLAAESTDNQMVRLAQNEIHFDKYIPISTILKRIESVTPDDIQSLAKEIFQMERSTLTTLGPTRNKKQFKNLLN